MQDKKKKDRDTGFLQIGFVVNVFFLLLQKPATNVERFQNIFIGLSQ